MTRRATNALEAAAIFAVIMTLWNGFIVWGTTVSPQSDSPTDMLTWWIPVLGIVGLFLITFLVWWLVFRSKAIGVWHATYAGLVIGLLWAMVSNLLLWGPAAVLFSAVIAGANAFAGLLEAAAMQSGFVILALLTRWWQLRRVTSAP